jgi:hypothetical protein
MRGLREHAGRHVAACAWQVLQLYSSVEHELGLVSCRVRVLSCCALLVGALPVVSPWAGLEDVRHGWGAA